MAAFRIEARNRPERLYHSVNNLYSQEIQISREAMTRLVIFGAGKIAEVVHGLLSDDPHYSVAGFTCDRQFMTHNEKQGLPIVAFEEVENLFSPAAFVMIVAIGYQDINAVRADRCKQAREKGYRLASWI